MPRAYYQVRKELPRKETKQLTSWEGRLHRQRATDELGQSVGQEVSLNLHRDGAVGVNGMRKFMRRLLKRLRTVGPTPKKDVAAFQATCHECQRLGPRVDLRGKTLWHVLPESLLLNSLNDRYSERRNVKGEAWRYFWTLFSENRTTDLHDYLDDVKIDFRNRQVFATIKEESYAWGDPNVWDATEACAALGLSKDWVGYRRGDRLWMLGYHLSDDTPTFKPTVADADWRSIFRPSENRVKVPGRTILLGPIRMATSFSGRHPAEGMLEVVHENVHLRSSSMHEKTGSPVLVSVADLGFNEGWDYGTKS